MIYVRESHVEKMGKIQDVSYEILNVLEFNRWVYICFYFAFFGFNNLSLFTTSGLTALTSINVCFLNSTRKRQSVVCRYPDGRLVLYCKVIGS